MRKLPASAAFWLAALCLSAVLGACVGPAPVAARPVETNLVELPPSYKFEPAVIRVTAGTTVSFHNSDNFTHAVQVLKDGFTLLNLPPGTSGSITFDQPGEYDYVCPSHTQQMKGKILVASRPGT